MWSQDTYRRPWARFAQLIAVLAVSCTVIGSASASEVPENAYSRSLSIPPVYLDYPSLLFQHPQWAGRVESQILGFSSSRYDEDELGLGAVVKWGPHALFVLSQPQLSLKPGFSSSSESVLLQAGSSIALGPLHLGAAVRSASKIDRGYDSDYRSGYEHDKLKDQILELAFGVGTGSLERNIDVTIAARYGEKDAISFRAPESGDTTSINLDSDNGTRLFVGARGKLPVGKEASLTAAAHWGDRSESWIGDQISGENVQRIKYDPHGDTWAVGVSLAAPAEHVQRVILTAHYDSRRDPDVYSVRSSQVELRRHVRRRASFGVSLFRNLWRSIDMQAGIRKVYEWNETHRRRIRFEGMELTSDEREEFWDEFSWGASYQWKNLSLVGAVSTTLSLEQFFLSLDARISL